MITCMIGNPPAERREQQSDAQEVDTYHREDRQN